MTNLIKRRKNMQKNIKRGVRLTAALIVMLMLVNSLLPTYGDTLTTYLGMSGSSSSDSAMSDADCMEEGRDVDTEIESEGAVLLRNENNTLPLEKGSKVTILGAMSYNYICGGTGSAGGKYDEYTYTMKEAFDGSKTEGSGVSTEKYLDVNEKAWNWLEEAVGGSRNADSKYEGHTGTGELSTIAGSDYVENKDAYGNGDWGGYSRVCEFDESVYEDNKDSFMQDGYNDVAIVTFGRSGAEGASPVMDYDGDGVASTGTTYLQLSEDELGLLDFCNKNYDKTIVLINSSTPIELGEIEQEEYGVDACLWIGHPGEAGLVGVAQVLTGDVNPSGHLVDTYAYDMSTMPSFYNNDDNKYTNVENIKTGFDQSNNFGYYQYEEGIYVGYRFYETADAEGYFDSDAFTTHEWKNGTAKGYDEVVQYPFGYGLSYTTFDEEVTASNIDLTAHSSNSITVKVTNTGDVAGKQVVQLYQEAPYGTDETCGISGVGLQKSAKALIGFQKTGIIEPGESEEVTITFDTDDLASFDSYGHGCYVLEKGDYKFHIGLNAHEDVCDPVEASLSESIIYDEDNAGARSSDEEVAKVAMSDVDAGDGNMLDGYLSRSDFTGGMETIMQHESSCKEEALSDALVDVLATPALGTTEYTYETYENGQKVQKTTTKYVGGADYEAYATDENVDGKDQNDDSYLYDDENTEHKIDYGKVYYVVVDDNGDPVVDDDGNYQVTEDETSKRLDVNCEFLKDVDYSNEIWAYLLDETTLDEQINVQGNLGWSTPAVESVNKTREDVVDGPGESGNGNSSYGTNTWFTSAVVNASTWNPYLLNKLGIAYAHQSIKNNLAGAYAPAMNTHRTPFGGRNFEYYSEDGFIGGKMGAAEVAGLQSEGIYVYIKHMAMNDNDTNRDGNITWFSEQAAREIMLKDYEICVKETYVVDDDEAGTGHFETGQGTLGIMASLNRDGISMFHPGMYRTILRNEWGFNGLVVTDGVGPYPWVMTPGAGLFGGVEGQLGGSTITTYYDYEGDATSTNYGKYLLRQTTKHMLYQVCQTGKLVRGENGATTGTPVWKVIMIVIDVVLALLAVLAIVLNIILPIVKKRRVNA
jgi:beta-glucosidase